MQAEIKLDYKDFMEMKNTIEALKKYKNEIEKGGNNIVVLEYDKPIFGLSLRIPTVHNIHAVPYLEDILVQIRKQYDEIIDLHRNKASLQRVEVLKDKFRLRQEFSFWSFVLGMFLGSLILYWL